MSDILLKTMRSKLTSKLGKASKNNAQSLNAIQKLQVKIKVQNQVREDCSRTKCFVSAKTYKIPLELISNCAKMIWFATRILIGVKRSHILSLRVGYLVKGVRCINNAKAIIASSQTNHCFTHTWSNQLTEFAQFNVIQFKQQIAMIIKTVLQVSIA